MNTTRLAHIAATTCLITLTFLCLGWELWWAPVRPGGSLLVLKALPLLLPLFGILRGRRYTFQWASMFVLLYLMEGLIRAFSDHGTGQWLAIAETLLSLSFMASAIVFLRVAPQR